MHKSIPIWRDATKLLLEVEQAVRHFPRYHKYTLGSEMRTMAMHLCRLINAAFNQKQAENKQQKIVQLVLAVDDLKLQIQLASYWGHFKHANSYRLRQSILQRFPWLALLFDVNALLSNRLQGNKTGVKCTRPKIIPHWQPALNQIVGYKSQIYFFQRLFPCAQLYIQRGVEQDKFPPVILATRHDHRVSRASLIAPGILVPHFQQIKAFVRQLYVKEYGYLKGGLKRRCIHYLTIQLGVELCLQ
jgi:hypothetical protein